MLIFNWFEATQSALQGAWAGFLGFIPNVIGALVIFILGWIVAEGIRQLVVKLLALLKFNQLFEQWGWKDAFSRANFKLDPSEFIAMVIRWAIVMVFLMASAEILGLTQFSVFLAEVLGYIGNVVIAALIFVVAAILADIVEKIVLASAERANISHARFLGQITRWSIWIFALLAILMQLQVAPSLIQTFVMGLVAMIAIAGGLAFGLGGKDVAREILEGIKNKVSG